MSERNDVFLSDVIDTSLFEKGYFNLIVAPCGSGKTTAAIKKIAPLASSPPKAIYLIDTNIGKQRLSREEGLILGKFDYVAQPLWYKDDNNPFNEKVCETSYAQFGYWCEDKINYAEQYEIIICDEPHSLISFSKIKNKDAALSDDNPHKIARKAICDAVNRKNVLVVGITATPDFLDELECPIKQIPIDTTNLRHYTQKETIYYSSINSILAQIPLGKRGGLYVQHVHPMEHYGDILRERGFNPLMLWSKNYEKPLSDKQREALQYIIENEKVPEEYDVFLFNATAETSINIRSHMDFFIAHNKEETHITQSRGRYRGDLDTLYIYKPDSNDGIVVPDEFLNRMLFREDMNQLREFLDIKKDKHGHQLSLPDLVSKLFDCGYSIEKGKQKRRDYWIITKV